jgi:hypothetical protein
LVANWKDLLMRAALLELSCGDGVL